MARAFTASPCRLGIAPAVGTTFLGVVYSVTLAHGLLSLQVPRQPIGDPWSSILEILLLFMTPLIVVLMVAVHAFALSDLKTFRLMALVFMSLLVGLSGIVVVDMRLRNIGIVGYADMFHITALLLVVVFQQTTPMTLGSTDPGGKA